MMRDEVVSALAEYLHNDMARINMDDAKIIAEDAVCGAEGAAREYDIMLGEYGRYDPREEALTASERNEGGV